MERRDVLRLMATGMVLQLAPRKLMAVAREVRTLVDSQPSPRTLNARQFSTVQTVAELIIPRTETPGATDVGTAQFIDLILTEWSNDAERTIFLSGLDDVDARAKLLFGKDFVDCVAAQQSEILMALGQKMTEDLDRRRNLPADERNATFDTSFYEMLRHLTLVGYYSSEAGATEELHFEIIPGHFDGCTTIAPAKEAVKNQ
jgi:gluconate 2-dehydrogenase gamma chain